MMAKRDSDARGIVAAFGFDGREAYVKFIDDPASAVKRCRNDQAVYVRVTEPPDLKGAEREARKALAEERRRDRGRGGGGVRGARSTWRCN